MRRRAPARLRSFVHHVLVLLLRGTLVRVHLLQPLPKLGHCKWFQHALFVAVLVAERGWALGTPLDRGFVALVAVVPRAPPARSILFRCLGSVLILLLAVKLADLVALNGRGVRRAHLAIHVAGRDLPHRNRAHRCAGIGVRSAVCSQAFAVVDL